MLWIKNLPEKTELELYNENFVKLMRNIDIKFYNNK